MPLSITSVYYIIIVIIIFFIYWGFNNKVKLQNFILLSVSFFIYGYTSPKLLFIISLSILFNFIVGIFFERTKYKKKLLIFGVYINLLFLGYFKYTNFFIFEITNFLNLINITTTQLVLNIIFPIGISFYTFVSIAYLVDVYNSKFVAYRDLIGFALMLSFFPKVLAGPIVIPSKFIEQINKKRTINPEKLTEALELILIGYLRKTIATLIGYKIDQYYLNPIGTGAYLTMLVLILYSFQIYADFSGYSDIAIGISKLFGIEILDNFHQPYLSKNVQEFWKRWHISLTTWLTKHLYITLGGSRRGAKKTALNIMIVFVLSGLWHGAGMNYVYWGILHGTYMIIYKYFFPIFKLDKIYNNKNIYVKFFYSFITRIFTFTWITFAWLFFRVENMSILYQIIIELFSINTNMQGLNSYIILILIIFAVLLPIDIIQYKRSTNIALKNESWFKKSIIFWTFILFNMIFQLSIDAPFIYEGY